MQIIGRRFYVFRTYVAQSYILVICQLMYVGYVVNVDNNDASAHYGYCRTYPSIELADKKF